MIEWQLVMIMFIQIVQMIIISVGFLGIRDDLHRLASKDKSNDHTNEC